jgi:hypothetical protein
MYSDPLPRPLTPHPRPSAMPNPSRPSGPRGLLAAGFLVLLGACSDASAPTALLPPVAVPDGSLAVLSCRADVAAESAECFAAEEAGPDGVSLNRIVGGSGLYLRLTSSAVSAADGLFTMNVTVQNLSDLAMATADGAASDPNGVRVFFHTAPVGAPAGAVEVVNGDGSAMITGANQPYFQYGGGAGSQLGGDGILASGETSAAKVWQFSYAPSVQSFNFTVYVQTATPPGPIATVAPQVSATSASTLVPGETVTLDGINFDPTPASNTVRIGGTAATVTAATTTQLSVVVPCVRSGTVGVQVERAGMAGVPVARTLQVNQRSLAVGQATVLSAAGEVGCNEIVASGGESRYVVAVFNSSGSTASSVAFQLSGDGHGSGGPLATSQVAAQVLGGPAPAAALMHRHAAEHAAADLKHDELLQKNAREYERLFRRFSGDARMRPSFNVSADPAEPPVNRTIRVSDINSASICQSHFTVNATRVFYAGKLAIYEDDATPEALRAANNPTMAAYYQAIGEQYNADMEPIIRQNFGDPIRRDLDNNGVLIALFTPLFNNQFPGVAGFVVSCDQFPTDPNGNATSNFGEFFYAMQPTSTTPGFGGGTADSWYRTIRATFIHETKHVASQAARVANGSPVWEASWLEEGTARHSEELWARHSIYNVAWKGNTGYGSAADFNSIYCDVRPTTVGCTDANPRRPSLNMWRHFSTGGLYWWMGNSRTSSPFGRTTSDNSAGAGAVFYATSWSLVRYAVDRYGVSDEHFLTALTQATTAGTTNLAARAGVSLPQLLGGWALALYADDYPGLATPSVDIQMPTWNFRSIYDGLRADFGTASYPRATHIVATPLGFGPVAPLSASGLTGGGVVYYEFSGTHASAQLLRLTGAEGGALPSTLGVAVARLQ